MIERFDIRCDLGNSVREQFRVHHLNLYLAAAQAIEEAELFGNRLIVDAACGCGHGYPMLGDLGRYVGLDNSDDALVAARRRYPAGYFGYGDLERPCPFRGVEPDVVVSLETAEHLRDPARFLRMVGYALPRDGLFIFSVPTCLTRDFDPFHRHDWGVGVWSDRLREAGFAIGESRTFSVSGSFREFCATMPTSPWQKMRVALFDLCHPGYLIDRAWNWLLMGRFRWESTLFICRKASVCSA